MTTSAKATKASQPAKKTTTRKPAQKKEKEKVVVPEEQKIILPGVSVSSYHDQTPHVCKYKDDVVVQPDVEVEKMAQDILSSLKEGKASSIPQTDSPISDPVEKASTDDGIDVNKTEPFILAPTYLYLNECVARPHKDTDSGQIMYCVTKVINGEARQTYVHKEIFELNHWNLDSLPFGLAFEYAKRGANVRRKAWPEHVLMTVLRSMEDTAIDLGDKILVLKPSISLINLQANSIQLGWTPDGEDLMAEDYYIVKD